MPNAWFSHNLNMEIAEPLPSTSSLFFIPRHGAGSARSLFAHGKAEHLLFVSCILMCSVMFFRSFLFKLAIDTSPAMPEFTTRMAGKLSDLGRGTLRWGIP